MNNTTSLRPVYLGPAPVVLKGHLEKIIAWQETVTDAAVKGNKNIALQALMLDPLGINPHRSEKMLAELLANSRTYLPQFK